MENKKEEQIIKEVEDGIRLALVKKMNSYKRETSKSYEREIAKSCKFGMSLGCVLCQFGMSLG